MASGALVAVRMPIVLIAKTMPECYYCEFKLENEDLRNHGIVQNFSLSEGK